MSEQYYSIKKSTLKGMADSIRAKTGKTDDIEVEDYSTEIASISGSGENLDSVLNEQAELITQLQRVLASKASGGGGDSDGTCTVYLHFKPHPENLIQLVNYTVTTLCDGNKIFVANEDPIFFITENIVVIDNVKCNSTLVLHCYDIESYGSSIEISCVNSELLGCAVFEPIFSILITASAGQDATITISSSLDGVIPWSMRNTEENPTIDEQGGNEV